MTVRSHSARCPATKRLIKSNRFWKKPLMFFHVYSCLTVTGSDACLRAVAGTFVYVSEGVKFGPHPLLDRVEQLHAADPLQLLGDPVSEPCRGGDRHQPASSATSCPPTPTPNTNCARRQLGVADSPRGGPWVIRMSMPSGMRFHLSSRDCPRGRLKPQPLNQGDLRHKAAW